MALAIAGVVTISAPASAAPRAGDRYDGRSATGQRSFVVVANGGDRLADYGIFVKTRCSDGRRRVQGLASGGEAPVRIDASGAFQNVRRPARLTYSNGGRPITGQATLLFKGTFDATGTSATGTVTASFRSKKVNCSARSVRFRVDVNGSPRSPFRDRSVATGRYAASGRGLASIAIQVFLPTEFVGPVRVRFRARCNNVTLNGTRTFDSFVLRGSSFGGTSSTTGPAGPGLRIRDRSSIRGRFFRARGGPYRVRGTFRLRGSLLRGGRKIDSCRTPLVRFSGRLRSGPKNL